MPVIDDINCFELKMKLMEKIKKKIDRNKTEVTGDRCGTVANLGRAKVVAGSGTRTGGDGIEKETRRTAVRRSTVTRLRPIAVITSGKKPAGVTEREKKVFEKKKKIQYTHATTPYT